METQIKGFYLEERGLITADIFGYASKGLPGLEIVGLGPRGKSIKEKFIYIGRLRGLRSPFKKYVLCVELSEIIKDKARVDLSWLELPLMLLFWFLSQQITIHSLNDCVACGQVGPDGKISLLNLNKEALMRSLLDVQTRGIRNLKYICKHMPNDIEDIYSLPISGLLGHIKDLYYQVAYLEGKNIIMAQEKKLEAISKIAISRS